MIKQVVDKEIDHSKGTSAYFRDLEKDVTLTFTLLARAHPINLYFQSIFDQ